MTNGKRPGAGFWVAFALIVALVGYPLSFGPACWLCDREFLSEDSVGQIYSPLLDLCCLPGLGRGMQCLVWYGELLPTPQPYLNPLPFGHSGWRIPQARVLCVSAAAKAYFRTRPPDR